MWIFIIGFLVILIIGIIGQNKVERDKRFRELEEKVEELERQLKKQSE
ncbi:hypothetical protein LCM20_13435 [Halobacillus litoralis]|nr:hypothetical protein [Halobacillus litoralis]MCA0971604.1 hypothetical protein [Halobacillus litoralis]